jgi:signal transduction histidine kinase
MLFAEPHRSLPIYKLIAILLDNNQGEIMGQRADGSLFPMYFAANEIHLGNRRLFTGIVQDLTDHKRMENEALERERLLLALEKERELRDFKTRFISMMSHEVRTPLSSILLSSDMLRVYGDKVEPSEREMYLDNIRTQVDYLTTLVREMVAVSGSDVNRLSFSPQMTDVVTLAQQIVDEYKLLYNDSHEVLFHSNVEHIEALLDLKLVRQILNNLISNAVKYTPHGAHVEVDLIRQNGSIVMKVSDSGPGIPEADVPLLFEPFHRGANAKSVPGTGLGLTVVKQSVELHNGRIEVDTAPNQGTTFTIVLPFRTSPD